MCVDTHLGQQAAGGSLVLNIYRMMSGKATLAAGSVIVQNAGGTVALSSGAPCEALAPGTYRMQVLTAPGAEDAMIHVF